MNKVGRITILRATIRPIQHTHIDREAWYSYCCALAEGLIEALLVDGGGGRFVNNSATANAHPKKEAPTVPMTELYGRCNSANNNNQAAAQKKTMRRLRLCIPTCVRTPHVDQAIQPVRAPVVPSNAVIHNCPATHDVTYTPDH